MYCYVNWIIYLSLGHISFAAECTRNGKYVCCSGYKRNKTSGKCDKCPPGYTGMDCVYKCTYPYYGENCFMNCKCSKVTCDFVSGCKVTSTAGTHMSSFKNRKMIPQKLETSFTYPTITSTGLSEESTTTGSASPPAFLVFYTTVALISLFVFFFSSTFFFICGKCLSPDKILKLLTPKLQIIVTPCMNVLSFLIICKKIINYR